MKSRRITLVIDSDFDHVSLVGLSVQTICASALTNKETVFHLELCVVEAVNNCIMHAYNKQPGNKIEIHIQLFPDRVIFQVCDSGRSMGDLSENIVDLDAWTHDVSSVPERGRGLFIIHKLMDEVAYTSEGRKNILTMRKRL